jgi:protein arginine kinase
MKKQISDAFSRSPAFVENDKERQPVVLSTRVRLARNLNGPPFPARANANQRRDVLKTCADALAALPKLKGGSLHEMEKLNNDERALLVENHLISKELTDSKDSAVFISRDQTCSVMINEEDHLRIQIVRGGFQLKKAWTQAGDLDTGLEKALELAFSPKFGYLTACPTNVGTGMRASAMLHLPGLVLSGQMEKVVRAVGADGLAVRGWFGEGSDATGSIFQISNQHTLGFSETDILAHLEHWLKNVIEQEENARLRLLEADDMRLFDQITRAFGILQNALLLTSAEAMGALSFMRLACDFGLLSPNVRADIDRLLIECQPAHVQAASNSKNVRMRDSHRALLVLKVFRPLPPIDFRKLLRK